MRAQKLWAFAPIVTAIAVLLMCLSATLSVSAEEAAQEITQSVCTHQNTTVINAVSATTKADGYTGDTQCVDCGAVISSGSKIAKIKSVKLSKTSYVYDGEAKTPKVTVTDSDGNKINSSLYTVTYKNNKKVGKATVTVKFTSADYNATVTETFKINPATVKLTSLTGVSKGFTAKWNTVAAQADGYQIQCATNSSFTKGKTSEKISGRKTASASVTSVKAQQKYYVRIRTYKTVGKTTYYSKWSNVKSVTTKQRITVFAGDSLATGLYPSSYNGIKYVDISGTEKVVAYKGLNTLTYQTLGKFSGGKSGLSTVIGYKPYRVYFMLGINEIEWKSVSSTIENYSEIIEQVQKKSPATDIVILSVSPVSRSVAASRRGFRKISTLNSELKKMTEKYGVSYYDYSVAFKDSSGYQLSKYNGGDGIHWNLNGYKKFAEIISDYDANKEKKGE